MKICIFGAGAIGGYMGVKLAQVGAVARTWQGRLPMHKIVQGFQSKCKKNAKGKSGQKI